jgi:hypothetical protein
MGSLDFVNLIMASGLLDFLKSSELLPDQMFPEAEPKTNMAQILLSYLRKSKSYICP